MEKYWSGLPFPSPGDLPDPGIEPRSPAFQADTLTSEPPGKPTEERGILSRASKRIETMNLVSSLAFSLKAIKCHWLVLD